MSIATLPPISARLPAVLRCRRTPSATMTAPPSTARRAAIDPGILDAYAIAVARDDRCEADAFAVRWAVYCRELGYEPAGRFPGGGEFDHEDLHALQVVAYHRASARPVGCFRLVLADPHDPMMPFHLESVCRDLAAGALPATPASRLGCVELSRFCIVESHRRHDAAEPPPDGVGEQRWRAETVHRRNLPALLWLCAAAIVERAGLDYLYALMDPRLEFLSRAMGLSFAAIGPAVRFRGARVPYRADRRSLRSMLQAYPEPAIRRLVEELAAGAVGHPMLAPYVAESEV